MPLCGITETTFFYFELEYLFLSGSTYYIEDTLLVAKHPVPLIINLNIVR